MSDEGRASKPEGEEVRRNVKSDLTAFRFAGSALEGWNGILNMDKGCPVCNALPEEFCINPNGTIRNDHKARWK